MLNTIFRNPRRRRFLNIVKYNKRIQNQLNLSIKDYKEYPQIEIEIIPKKGKYGEFINIDEDDEKYYHIYFNDNKEEKDNFFNKEDNVTKIKVIIDYQVKSFKDLFSGCYCIESINFKKFYRDNITDMSGMFSECKSLKELNLNNFNTYNVTNMSVMFNGCKSLK